jgi:alpha-galactosidase
MTNELTHAGSRCAPRLVACLDAERQLARIGNGLLELEWQLGDTLRLKSLRALATGAEWIPAPPEFAWGADTFHAALVTTDRRDLWPELAPPSCAFTLRLSRPASSDSLSSVTAEAGSATGGAVLTGGTPGQLMPDRCQASVEGDTARLVIVMAYPERGVEVAVHVELREGVPALRHWCEVRNTADTPLRLHSLSSLQLALRPSPADLDLLWFESFNHPCHDKAASRWRLAQPRCERLGAGLRRTLHYSVYPREHDGSFGCLGWAALRDPALDEGLFFGWEWSGDFDFEVGDFRDGAGVFGVRAGFSEAGDYYRDLVPGESFVVPKTLLGCFRGGLEDAGRATRNTAETLYGLPWPEGKAPMFTGYDTWSNWQDFKTNRNHLLPGRLDREIDIARELGCELFILDYDWFPMLGDFRSDPARFPDGIEAYTRRIKAAGMKIGLWSGFGQAHADAPVVREHPEWLVTRGGRAVSGGWGMVQLCLGYSPCRDWVLEQLTRIIREFGVDWIKHDFDLIPVSDAHHHAPHARDTRIESVLGYYHIMEQLHARFPKLYLDNWTPANGGSDFGAFQRHHSMLMCDWYAPVGVRSMHAGLTHLVPSPRTHTYIRGFSVADERSPYTYRSAAFGNGVYLLNDILQWDDTTRAAVSRELALFKQDRDLFHAGTVYDLLGQTPSHYGWDARFVYDAQAGRGMAQVFRNHDPRTAMPIRLRGLEADATYRIEQVDAGTSTQASGAALMTEGVAVTLPTPFSAETLRIAREGDRR